MRFFAGVSFVSRTNGVRAAIQRIGMAVERGRDEGLLWIREQRFFHMVLTETLVVERQVL